MLNSLKNRLLKPLSDSLKLDSSKILQLLEVPKVHDHGHLSLPVYNIAKEQKQNPIQLAQQISTQLNGQIPGVESVGSIQGFINFKFNPSVLKESLFENFKSEQQIGFSNFGHDKTVLVDFSSPNIAKPMHIGHLRSTVIGQALRNLAESQGFKVIAVNHLGDWGSQFGKLAWAIETWGQDIDFAENPMQKLLDLYVRFHAEAEKNPELEQKGAATFKRLEDGDPAVEKTWKQIIEWSLQDYQKVYGMLGTKHDVYLGESFYNDKMAAVLRQLEEKKLLQTSEGAEVVFFDEKENMPPCLIRKSDGASIYATRDLAAAIYRHDVQKADIVLYVVGQEQALHFKQVFRVLEKMGLDWVKNYHHISFGLYKFKDGKMSTRQGKVILLEDVLSKAIEMVKQIIQEKNPDLDNKDFVAQQVAIGAITFHDLVNDRTRNVEFDWDKILSFEGDSGPYIQYTVVRCRSLLKKSSFGFSAAKISGLESMEEQKLIFSLLQLEDVLKKSFDGFKPNVLAQYLLEVCAQFSTFYHKHRILGEDPQVQAGRLSLVYATEKVLTQGLSLLNVPTPDAM